MTAGRPRPGSPIPRPSPSICGTRCAWPTPGSDSIPCAALMRCSGRWCWPGWSSRSASWPRSGCWTRSASPAPGYRTIRRRLPGYATDEWRQRLAAACAAHVGLGAGDLGALRVTVRHEALVARAEVRDHCRGPCRSRGCEAGGSLTGETPRRWEQPRQKPCRVSTVGWRGRGERAEEVYARNRCDHLS